MRGGQRATLACFRESRKSSSISSASGHWVGATERLELRARLPPDRARLRGPPAGSPSSMLCCVV